MNVAVRFVWATLLFLSLPATGLAQDAPNDGEHVERARTLFVEGVSALDAGRFAEAAELLGRSLELRESPPARYNHALALRGAGRYLAAIQDVERYLEIATEERHADTRAQAAELLTELRGSIGHLRVEITGGAERVEIDGAVAAEDDGVIELDRDPGPARILVVREGHAPVERRVEVRAGERVELTIDAAELELPATLIIDAEPQDAAIRVDGQMLGLGRAQLQTTPGEHSVELSADGYEDQTRTVTVAPGRTTRLSISLTGQSGQSTSPTSKWWFWALLGTGIAAVGVAVTVTVVELQPADIEKGSLGFSQAVLRY